MDEERIESSSSDQYKNGTAIFEKICPAYMAMGMTVTEFWHGEAELCRYYRKADELRKQQRNEEMWLQGAYIYNVMLDVYPVYHSFIKHPKPTPYLEYPFPLSAKEAERQKEEKERRRAELFKEQMLAWAEKVNSQFKEQREEDGSE